MTSNEISGPNFIAPKDEGKALTKVMIMLHGLGADGDDLISLAPYFAEKLSGFAYVAPNAPFNCDMAPMGYQWFSLQSREEADILHGLEVAEPILNHYIDQVMETYGVSSDDIYLMGFSQGSMLSMYTALKRKQPLGGVLAYSGALMGGDAWLKEHMQSTLPLCLIHGELDDVVPFEAFEEALSALQANQIEVHGYSREDLGHGIDPAGVQIGTHFIADLVSR